MNTIVGMPKTEQVRIPSELAKDARIVAAANDETLSEYLTRVVSEAVARDLPAAARKVSERAASQASAAEPKSGRKKRE